MGERIREIQKEDRKQIIMAEFKKFDKDGNDRLDVNEIMPLLGHLGLRIKADDRDRVQRMIDEFDVDLSGDGGDVGFAEFEEFEDIVQRILEKLQFIAAEQTIAFARSMGFSTKELGDYHWAFDQIDKDMSGGM